jgi:hypothetical protein
MSDKVLTAGTLQVVRLDVVRNASKERRFSSGCSVLAPGADGRELEPGQVEVS